MAKSKLLIVGQGLAGTMLAWECERAGLDFTVAAPPTGVRQSFAAAGIVNPITGRRLVKSWRVEALLPLARAAFGSLERALGQACWRDVRIRRLFADTRERAAFAAKWPAGELAPYAIAPDADGFGIDGGARVDLRPLLSAAHDRWYGQGRVLPADVDPAEQLRHYDPVIDCRGLAAAGAGMLQWVPWEYSRGELIGIAVDGLEPEVILNRRQWVLPVGAGRAWVGATHQPGERNAATTPAARAILETAARELIQRPFAVTGHWAGVRVNLPDKRPVAGWHPSVPRLGLLNGLGAKGVLFAPFLAQQWVAHLTRGAAFDPEVTTERFFPRASA